MWRWGVLAGAVGLWPELSISRIDRTAQTIERGGNPLDTWSPEWVFGFPMLRVYQPLAHLLVAVVYFALGKTVSLVTVFVWVRLLAVAQMHCCRLREQAAAYPATRSRTLNSSFHRRPSRATHHSCSMPVSVTTLSKLTGTISVVSPLSNATSMGDNSSSASP